MIQKMKVSAVLVPIFLKAGQYHLLFIQRTERVREHKGQISFPGGAYEKADGLLLNTALREAEEEIGLAPGDVEVLGNWMMCQLQPQTMLFHLSSGRFHTHTNSNWINGRRKSLFEVPIASFIG